MRNAMELIMSAIADGVIGPDVNTMKKMRRMMKMTLEEYAVKRIERLEGDNEFLRNNAQDTYEELKRIQEAYNDLKDFLKKHVTKCTAAEGYKMDKYFWENDPEYNFVANLVDEDRPF